MELNNMTLERNRQYADSVAEQGFILIVTMLILVVLTVLCIASLDNSTFEVQIAANDRQSRVAFNLADGGAYAAGKLISETIALADNPTAYGDLVFTDILDPTDTDYSPSVALNDASVAKFANAQVAGRDLFVSRVKGTVEPSLIANDEFDFMLRDVNGQGDIFGRITAQSVKVMAGGGAEFASGASGVGSGSAGSTAVTIDLDIDAYSARNSRSRLAVRYRKVLGAAGGL
jgi:hypothetical protein